jgi:hypothetical protein
MSDKKDRKEAFLQVFSAKELASWHMQITLRSIFYQI